MQHILESPADYIESAQYYSWERFFTKLLTENTQGTYLKYSKSKLNASYLQANDTAKIMNVMPEIRWNQRTAE